jgi:hypothetical protein
MSDFGPYVPVFVPWVAIYRIHNLSSNPVHYPDVIRPVLKALRSDFLYVTNCDNDYGIEGMRIPNPDVPPNLLLISGSGRGHVPILLHMADRPHVEAVEQENLIIFRGKMKWEARVALVTHWQRVFGKRITVGAKVQEWANESGKYAFVLSPRGNARGKFRTSEILQMGLIPILAFRQRKWVPYLNSSLPWDDIAFHIVWKDVERMKPILESVTPERLRDMRKTVLKYRKSHFTHRATMTQIGLFLKYGYERSDLRCDQFYPTTA